VRKVFGFVLTLDVKCAGSLEGPLVPISSLDRTASTGDFDVGHTLTLAPKNIKSEFQKVGRFVSEAAYTDSSEL
jgi:hypothetical protein